MKCPAMVLALAACSATGLDVITPDALTVGHGVGEHSGTAFRNDPFAGYEGESESTYAALTWNLPSFQDERLTREERTAIRNANIARDQGINEPSQITDGTKPMPSPWIFVGIAAIIAALVLAALRRSRRRSWR